MNSDAKIVWSDEQGDMRKKSSSAKGGSGPVDESSLCLELRRLTSGKGRSVIEVKGLPADKKWCKKLASRLKKSLGAGGAYKSDFIEIHTAEVSNVSGLLDKFGIKWKKTGG